MTNLLISIRGYNIVTGVIMVIGIILGAVFGAVFGYIIGWLLGFFPNFSNALVSGLQAFGIPMGAMGGLAPFLAAVGFILGLLGGILSLLMRKRY
jgi:hypothetical protein